LQLEALWIAAYLLATSCFAPPLGHGLYTAIENFFSCLAAKPPRCVLAIFFATIVLRLLILPIFAIPEPYAHDEFCYLLQADMFAHGHISYPPHPMAAYLETFYVTFHPTYSTMYSPAQSVALALGQLLGHPWIGVLLSTSAMVAAILWMLQGWLPPRWALLGAIIVLIRIALFSYWMNSYWGGSVAALGAALVLGAIPRLKKTQRTRDALLLGFGIIILANSRPLEGFIFCIPVAIILFLWLLDLRKKQQPIPVRRVLLPILFCLSANFLFTLYYDWRITGDPFAVPRAVYYKQFLSVSPFIWGKIGPPLHYANPQYDAFFNGWIRSIYTRTWASLRQNELLRLNEFWLFLVGIPFSVAFLTLPSLLKDRRIRPALWYFLVCVLGLVVVTWFEPHYAAPAFCIFLIILFQAVRHLRTWQCHSRPVGISLTRQIVTLTLLSIPVCLYEHVQNPHGISCWSYQPLWTRAHIAYWLQNMPGDHVVIVRYPPHHDYRDQWVYNAADIDHSRIVWAHDVPGQDLSPLLSYFSNRKVWILEPDSVPPQLYSYTGQPPWPTQ